jgi:hypothetical protein
MVAGVALIDLVPGIAVGDKAKDIHDRTYDTCPNGTS